MSKTSQPAQKITFTSYQVAVIVILALTQFTVILDFMVMNPISDMLIKTLRISPSQLGVVVSAYAISAAVSGVITAGFADRYDRKKLLVFFYTGFFLGTLLCGLARSFEGLLLGRIIAGIFGGVISSVSMAIVTDLFPLNTRGRVMGYIQMAFAASQVLGIPLSIYLANAMGWYFPFILIAAFIGVIWIFINLSMRPVNEHLRIQTTHNPLRHMFKTLGRRDYRMAFMASCLMPIGGYLLMPFGNPYLINNMQIPKENVPFIFLVMGICSILIMPMVGKISDSVGKYRTLVAGSVLASLMVIVYANLPVVPLWGIIVVNALMFAGIMSRMIPSSALVSAVPDAADRGAFMSINASLTSLAGGIASLMGGFIVKQKDEFSPLEHYDILSYVCVAVILLCIYFMWRVNRMVAQKTHDQTGNV